MLSDVHRSLAAEREAREAAFKEKALIQIELEAKQRLAFHMREVGAGPAGCRRWGALAGAAACLRGR